MRTIDRTDAEMIRTLGQMSVISEQAAVAYDKDRVHGGEKDRAPAPLTDKPMVDYWRDRYNRAHGPISRQTILEEAQEALNRARRMHIPEGQPPTIDSPLWKQWVGQSGLSASELVRLFNVRRQYIHRILADYRDS